MLTLLLLLLRVCNCPVKLKDTETLANSSELRDLICCALDLLGLRMDRRVANLPHTRRIAMRTVSAWTPVTTAAVKGKAGHTMC